MRRLWRDREQPSQELARTDTVPVFVEPAYGRQAGHVANDAELQLSWQGAEAIFPFRDLGLPHCFYCRIVILVGGLKAFE